MDAPTSNLIEQEIDSEDEADLFCPALPPQLQKQINKIPQRRDIVGPTLPDNYIPPNLKDNNDATISSEDECASDKDEIVGPIPSTAGEDDRFNVPEMEYRVQKMIADVTKKPDGQLERESWMLELPSGKPSILALGLGARQFRKKNAADLGDRTVWTDTPEDKERKRINNKESCSPSDCIQDLVGKKRDEELTKRVKEYEDKKRSVPLIESHKKKKAKIDNSRPKERKPFSREDDLSVNKFDEAQKETILKKARKLNDRFSAGNRKFL